MHTIESDERGAHEIALTPGTPEQVQITPRSRFSWSSDVVVFAHSADVAVYARQGTDDIAPGDPKATIIPTGTWATLTVFESGDPVVTLVSASAAVVSVVRS